MGQCCGRKVGFTNRQNISCPRCNLVFPRGTITNGQFNQHLDRCLQQQSGNPMQVEVQVQNQEQHLSFWERVGDNEQWEKRQFDVQNLNTLHAKSEEDIRVSSFGEKQVWFRGRLEKLRISWQDGCTFVRISGEDLLRSSYQNLHVLNNEQLHGELKIVLAEDAKVLDAGGLLREWVNLTSTKLLETGSLIKVNADGYHFCSVERNEDFELFGLLAGKALFEKIPIPVLLGRPLLKSILDLSIELEDFKHYDPSTYASFKYMIEHEIDPLDIMLDFTVESGGQQIPLKENGNNIFVTNQNKAEYIELAIRYWTSVSIDSNLQSFMKGFFRIVPRGYLQVFTPEELEMVLFGLPFINLEDWRTNTQYKGVYNNDHQVIVWFWEVLTKFTQQQLSQFLRFCTGSSRTPVAGFKKLEANRGEVMPFCIESQVLLSTNPYPKAHTCFNRLELPLYTSSTELEMYILATLDSILEGQFGLE